MRDGLGRNLRAVRGTGLQLAKGQAAAISAKDHTLPEYAAIPKRVRARNEWRATAVKSQRSTLPASTLHQRFEFPPATIRCDFASHSRKTAFRVLLRIFSDEARLTLFPSSRATTMSPHLRSKTGEKPLVGAGYVKDNSTSDRLLSPQP